MWQELIVGSCVITALAFVLYHYLPGRGRKTGGNCGSCNGCDSKKACR